MLAYSWCAPSFCFFRVKTTSPVDGDFAVAQGCPPFCSRGNPGSGSLGCAQLNAEGITVTLDHLVRSSPVSPKRPKLGCISSYARRDPRRRHSRQCLAQAHSSGLDLSLRGVRRQRGTTVAARANSAVSCASIWNPANTRIARSKSFEPPRAPCAGRHRDFSPNLYRQAAGHQKTLRRKDPRAPLQGRLPGTRIGRFSSKADVDRQLCGAHRYLFGVRCLPGNRDSRRA